MALSTLFMSTTINLFLLGGPPPAYPSAVVGTRGSLGRFDDESVHSIVGQPAAEHNVRIAAQCQLSHIVVCGNVACTFGNHVPRVPTVGRSYDAARPPCR